MLCVINSNWYWFDYYNILEHEFVLINPKDVDDISKSYLQVILLSACACVMGLSPYFWKWEEWNKRLCKIPFMPYSFLQQFFNAIMLEIKRIKLPMFSLQNVGFALCRKYYRCIWQSYLEWIMLRIPESNQSFSSDAWLMGIGHYCFSFSSMIIIYGS